MGEYKGNFIMKRARTTQGKNYNIEWGNKRETYKKQITSKWDKERAMLAQIKTTH